MNSKTKLTFTSHVGRNLIASAAGFKNEAIAVWEYVVNSLQYVDTNVIPHVQVNVSPRKKVIEICDNGSGMDIETLANFFTMHGENLERQRGKHGRGKFGTGKSAAFGIGKQFRIETRKNGKLNIIELFREDIDVSSGGNIPLRHIVKDEPTEKANGTSITISQLFVNARTTSIIQYIERHLSAFRGQSPVVMVNSHICEYKEPDVVEEHVFHPSLDQQKTLGNITLTVKESKKPLDELDQGIHVTAGRGNLVGIEDCGVSKKPYGSYIFGEVDVPAVEEKNTPVEPYSSSRDLKLNPNHPVVTVLVGFLGASIEKVRDNIVEKYKEAQQSEQARRLNAEANKIAEVLNQDFQNVQDKLDNVRSAMSKPGPATSSFGSAAEGGKEDDNTWVSGIDQPGEIEKSDNKPNITNGVKGRDKPDISASGEPNETGSDSVSKAGGSGKKRKPKGGFVVDFEHHGAESDRSLYDDAALRIVINLDHPVVKAAYAISGAEDPTFRRLAYEIAFSEYAIALGYEALAQDSEQPGDDLLYEVRATLNRVSASAAELYKDK